MSDTMIRLLKHNIADAEARLQRFSNDFERSPAHAFEWSAGAFEAAATQQVLAHILKWIESGKSHDEMSGLVQAEVNLRAQRGSKSTSEASNLMTAELMSAWARAIDLLQYGAAQ